LTKQTHKNLDFVFLDCNRKSGEIVELIEEHGWEKQARLIIGTGVSGAALRNLALANAYGELIYFCQPGVVLSAGMLERLVQEFNNHSDAFFTYTDVYFGSEAIKFPDFADFVWDNVCFVSSLFRTDSCPKFDEKVINLHDVDLYFKIKKSALLGYHVKEPLCYVTENPSLLETEGWEDDYVYLLDQK